jgi:hypothetical protein
VATDRPSEPEIDRPSVPEIRRALAECMTLGDIDDAMGWSPGTARRRRWRPLERGGLPSADAELGGAALWFRSTVETWQESRAARGSRDRSSGAAPAAPPLDPALEIPVQSQPPEGAPADPQPVEAGEAARPAELTDEAAPSPVEAPSEQESATPAEERVESVDRPDDQAARAETEAPFADEVGPDQGGASDDEEHSDDDEVLEQADLEPDEPARGEELPVVESGFALTPGQRVLADVHGQWREAWVGHRDRATVVVDYNLDGTPLGARQLRISVSRVRIPNDG